MRIKEVYDTFTANIYEKEILENKNRVLIMFKDGVLKATINRNGINTDAYYNAIDTIEIDKVRYELKIFNKNYVGVFDMQTIRNIGIRGLKKYEN